MNLLLYLSGAQCFELITLDESIIRVQHFPLCLPLFVILFSEFLNSGKAVFTELVLKMQFLKNVSGNVFGVFSFSVFVTAL